MTNSYIRRCQMAKSPSNADLVSFLNSYQPEVGPVPGALRMRNVQLSMDTVSVIARLLEDPSQPSTQVAALELVNSSLDDMQFSVLMDALKKSGSVEELNLSDNDLTPEMVKQIVEVITKPGSRIQTLRLDNTKIGDAGASAILGVLAQTKISTLSLVGCDISTEGITPLGEIVTVERPPMLRHLILNNNPRICQSVTGVDIISGVCEQARKLKDIELENIGLDDDGVCLHLLRNSLDFFFFFYFCFGGASVCCTARSCSLPLFIISLCFPLLFSLFSAQK